MARLHATVRVNAVQFLSAADTSCWWYSAISLARSLPDYWQRFDAARARFLAEPASTPPADGSGGEGRGLLARLFGRG